MVLISGNHVHASMRFILSVHHTSSHICNHICHKKLQHNLPKELILGNASERWFMFRVVGMSARLPFQGRGRPGLGASAFPSSSSSPSSPSSLTSPHHMLVKAHIIALIITMVIILLSGVRCSPHLMSHLLSKIAQSAFAAFQLFPEVVPAIKFSEEAQVTYT